MTGDPSKPSFASIADAVAAHAASGLPDRPLVFLSSGIDGRDYPALWAQTLRIAGGLQQEGIGAGDRVALAMATSFEVMAAMVAVSALGAVLVPVQPEGPSGGSGGRERTLAALTVARPIVLLAPSAEAVPAGVTGIRVLDIATLDGDCSGFPLLTDGDPALLQFSSGSTGEPKGILLSRGNLAANLTAIVERVDWQPDDVVLSWLPLYHDLGLISVGMSSLWAGAALYLYAPDRFVRNPLGWLRLASDLGATMLCAPQFAFSVCAAKLSIDSAALRGADLSAVRFTFNGSEFVNWDACRRFEELLAPYGLRPDNVQPGYGLAENGAGVSVRRPFEKVRTIRLPRGAETSFVPSDGGDEVVLAGNGTPLMGTEVAVFDADGSRVETGRIGELHFRGTSAAAVYITSGGPVPIARADGWIPSGDVGMLRDGEIFVVGRTKELIKVAGRTIMPSDVETSLELELGLEPGSVAVFAHFDSDRLAEVASAVVELPRPRLTRCPADLGQQARRSVARKFKLQLHTVYAVRRGSIPRTSSGKVRRVLMANMVAAGRLAETLRMRPDDDVVVFRG